MRFILLEAPRKISIQKTEIPEVKGSQVLVRVKYCGICVYDLKRYLGLKKISYPVILGHEPSGIVEKTGPYVENIRQGDRVAVDVKVRCGECAECLRGMESRCREAEASGGFSQYIMVPEENVIKLSENLDLKTAALTEPLACILHGYDKLSLEEKGSLLVVGDGIMGVLAGFVGKTVHKQNVYMLGHNKERMKAAQGYGAGCFSSPEQSIKARGEAFEIVIFTVADRVIIDNIEKFLLPGGKALFIGELKEKDLCFDLNKIYTNEFIFLGRKGYSRKNFRDAVGLIEENDKKLEKFITKIYQLEDLETGFKDLLKRKILKGILSLDNFRV